MTRPATPFRNQAGETQASPSQHVKDIISEKSGEGRIPLYQLSYLPA